MEQTASIDKNKKVMRWSWGRRDARRILECMRGAARRKEGRGHSSEYGRERVEFHREVWED